MLAIKETAADFSHSQGAYFDGSLELLRDLAITVDVDAALPRLSAIVNKMLPHDALRMACFDQRGRPIVNASTAEVPPEPLVCVTFWSKRPLAFNRTHVPLARRIAYHLGLGASRGELGKFTHRSDDDRAQLVDAGVQRAVEQATMGTHVRIVGESAEWRGVLRKATQVGWSDTRGKTVPSSI
jgi:hypothetical protein